MDEQKHFKSMITKACSSLRIVTGVRAQIDLETIQVSIDAKGTKKSRRLKKFAKRISRLERDLKKEFPGRVVSVHIWVTGKRLSLHKASKPFRGRNIVLFANPVRL